MQKTSDFLTRGQVAALFGVSAHTVTRWAREGKLPHLVTPGGQYRFPRESIQASSREAAVPAGKN